MAEKMTDEQIKAELASMSRQQLEAAFQTCFAELNQVRDERDTLRLRLQNERLLNNNLLDSMA